MWRRRGGSTGKQCEPLFSTYHPNSSSSSSLGGSQRRRHASATSSPPVTFHIKAGDFSSAVALVLFLPTLWVSLLARRVPGCAVIIPQVFGWREGPSHLCQKEREECGQWCCCVSRDVILSAFIGLVFVCSCWSTFSGYFYQVVKLLTRSKSLTELASCVCCRHCCQNKFETSPLCWNSPICSPQVKQMRRIARYDNSPLYLRGRVPV